MRIRIETCQAMVIDFQEKLMPVIAEKEEILKRTAVLLQGLSVLQVPVTVTCQYQKGLGSTVEALYQYIPEAKQWDKITFSCLGDDGIRQAVLSRKERKQVLICGVESHICVLQTVLDLIEEGFVPVVVTDCIGSRFVSDKEAALLRMQQEGALFTSAESILYELTERAGSEVFKQVSRLTRER